jgi:DNA-binding HxlR family transcriptional regulator
MSNHVAPGASVAAAEIIVALDPNAHSFASLIRKIRGASDAILTAALSDLLAQGFVKRFGAKFQLTNRGYELVCACRPGRKRDRRTKPMAA